ncbi:hypothetical protein RJ641_001287 [Dillenia turbinata]|uniref:Uncharacterized protein n=1 Tax=Dillenia turbinata TaxID=194707 RepID=A0AAN8W7W7_9MAGN
MIEKDGADDWKKGTQTLGALGRAFERSRIAGVRQEPRLRGQEPRLRAQDFGHRKSERRKSFVFIMAVSSTAFLMGFQENLKADIDIGHFQPPGVRNPNMNIVIVLHGLTLRVFLMRRRISLKDNNLGNGKIKVMERGYGDRYSLLMHHTASELGGFGLTDEMLTEQEWQKFARPGELNYDCSITGPSFFPHSDG